MAIARTHTQNSIIWAVTASHDWLPVLKGPNVDKRIEWAYGQWILDQRSKANPASDIWTNSNKVLIKDRHYIKYGGNNGFLRTGGLTLWHTQEAYQAVKPIAHLIAHLISR